MLELSFHLSADVICMFRTIMEWRSEQVNFRQLKGLVIENSQPIAAFRAAS
jgi:hypothetical protein